MALMKCKECGAPVSTEASKCPQCGHRFPKGGDRTAMWLILAFLGLGAILLTWAHLTHP
jgi:hypothetical protein